MHLLDTTRTAYFFDFWAVLYIFVVCSNGVEQSRFWCRADFSSRWISSRWPFSRRARAKDYIKFQPLIGWSVLAFWGNESFKKIFTYSHWTSYLIVLLFSSPDADKNLLFSQKLCLWFESFQFLKQKLGMKSQTWVK